MIDRSPPAEAVGVAGSAGRRGDALVGASVGIGDHAQPAPGGRLERGPSVVQRARELVVGELGQRSVIARVEADLEAGLRELPHLRPRQAVRGRVLADELARARRATAARTAAGACSTSAARAGERLLGAGVQAGRAKRRAWVEAAVRRRLQALPPEPVRFVEARPGQKERGGAREAPE